MSSPAGGARAALLRELGCLALALVPMAPLVCGRSFVGGDLLPLFLPLLAGVQEALQAGALHTWDPRLFGGYPALAALQAGSLYPPHLLLLALAPLLLALKLSYLLHAWALVRGWCALVRALGGSTRAGLLAGASSLLCGSCAGHVWHLTVFVSMAWAPWILLLAARAAGRGGRAGWRAALLLAAVQGLAFLEVSPQWAAYTAVAALLVAVGLASREGSPVGSAWAGLARVGAGLAGGGLLAAGQLLPGLEYLRLCPRLRAPEWEALVARGPRLEELPAWVLGDPAALGDGGSAAALGDGGSAAAGTPELLFPGAAVWVLALFGLGRGRADPLRRASLPLIGAGLLLSQGWLVQATPLGAFRLPVRALWLVQAGLALLAAGGLDVLLRGPGPAARRSALLGAGALFGLALLGRGLLGQPWGAGALWALAGAGAVLASGFLACPRARRAAVAVALALLVLELWLPWRARNETLPDPQMRAPPPLAGPVAASPNPRTLDLASHYGIAAPEQARRLRRNAGVLHGLEYLSGYESLPPAPQELRVEELRRCAAEDPRAFAAACAAHSVRWVVLDRDAPHGAPPGLRAAASDAGVTLYELPGARPRCYLLDRQGRAREVGFVRPWPAALELEPLRLEAPARLVLPVAFWPDWVVEVNGHPLAGEDLPLEQGLFLSLELPAGAHRVAARFESQTLAIGLLLGAAGWVAWAGLLWLGRRGTT